MSHDFISYLHHRGFGCSQGPSLLKTLGGPTFIVCVSMMSPCPLDRSTTFL